MDPTPNQLGAARMLRTLADHIESRQGLKAYVTQTRGVVLVDQAMDLYSTEPLPDTQTYGYDGTGEITIRWYDPESRTT